MPILTVRRGASKLEISFEGTPMLADILQANGLHVARPCGGRGACGKCKAEMRGNIQTRDDLICQTRLLGNTEVVLPEDKQAQIETESSGEAKAVRPMAGTVGAAVDIGTTTLAAKLYDLKTGKVIGESGHINPQTEIAADVMGRIGAALNGKADTLRESVTEAIREMIGKQCDVAVITGNTTMLYLLTGRSPETLSHAPFEADCLFGQYETVAETRTYLPSCMNAFVGADITCAALACGLCDSEETGLMIDVGTNGEIALWKGGRLYVTSTAAGPAFEGAGISCGCGSIEGAIDKVDAGLNCHTIGDKPAVGVCGSGLIDAIAAHLTLENIDETGAVEDDDLPLANGIALLPKDVRAVQLAKAAIAAGLKTLLTLTETDMDDIKTFYIAGGFGSHLNVKSAVRIGLIPAELESKVRVVGNAALAGAAKLLLDEDEVARAKAIASKSWHVNLGGNPTFNEAYMDEMFFPEED